MTIVFVIIAILTLSVLVLIHELGHFIAAKRGGVWVEEFGIGYPPRAFGKKIGETIYSVNWLPLGGFVKLHGENNAKGVTKRDRAFYFKSKTLRIVVSLAGVFMNIVYAIVVFGGIALVVGGFARGIIIDEVQDGTPAHEAGLLPDDRIVSVGGTKVLYTEFFQPLIEEKKGEEIVLGVERVVDGGTKQLQLPIFARDEVPDGEGRLGVVFSPIEFVRPGFVTGLFEYGRYGVQKSWFLAGRITSGLGTVASQATQGQVPEGVGGPITVTAVLAEFARFGLLPLLEFSAIISINLAIINLLPIPPLDGYRAISVAAEGIVGKRLMPRVENVIQTAGFVFLIGLVVLLTAREIPKLIGAGSLSGFVDSVLGV